MSWRHCCVRRSSEPQLSRYEPVGSHQQSQNPLGPAQRGKAFQGCPILGCDPACQVLGIVFATLILLLTFIALSSVRPTPQQRATSIESLFGCLSLSLPVARKLLEGVGEVHDTYTGRRQLRLQPCRRRMVVLYQFPRWHFHHIHYIQFVLRPRSLQLPSHVHSMSLSHK